MKIPRELTVLIGVACGVGLTWAQEPAKTDAQPAAGKTVDLTKIERKILAEPEYIAKKQQYCLLVFGPEAKFRVWLVHDADVLYVDRNGDGHIADRGEQVNGNHTGRFKVGDIVERPGKAKHTSLMVYFSKGGTGSLSILIGGKVLQEAYFQSSEKPTDAPIVHLNAPVSLKLRAPQQISPKGGVGPKNMLRRSRDVALSGFLETPGLGSFARYRPKDVLPKGEITLDVEFSKKGAKGGGPRARGTMKPGFDGDFEMEGAVRVPDDAPLGDVELRVTFPENKEVRLVPPVIGGIRIYEK
jgi:hypothetical protein